MLTYTRDLPTKPGWYWCLRETGRSEVCRVFRQLRKTMISEWDDYEYKSYRPIAETTYRWFAGPIEEPREHA